jgi:hypothetical protein
MARIRFAVHSAGEVALVTATAKTVVQVIAATNTRVAVRGYSVSFDGVAGDGEPVVVDVMRQTDGGSGSSAATVAKDDPGGSETLQTTGIKGPTSEPSASTILRQYNIHPQTGAEWRLAFDEEIIIAGGGRLGLRCTAPAGVNALASFFCEE